MLICDNLLQKWKYQVTRVAYCISVGFIRTYAFHPDVSQILEDGSDIEGAALVA